MEKISRLPARRERPVRDALETASWWRRASAAERRLAEDYLEGFNAAPIDRASVKAIVQQMRAAERIDGDRIARLPRGYDVVPRRLAQGLRVELGVRVREIRWTHSSVQALTEHGAWEGARAIVTLPLGVLQARSVRFVPPLPRRKEAAIDALSMGAVVKVALLFHRPWWPRDLASTRRASRCRRSGGRCPRERRPSSGGRPAATRRRCGERTRLRRRSGPSPRRWEGGCGPCGR